MKAKITQAVMIAAAVLCLMPAARVICQQTLPTTVRIYRGSIGNSHIQMNLSITNNKVTGTYSYDNVGQELKLTGSLDDQGRLELKELDAKGKQTGKFICKRKLEDPIDPECSWSRPDGTLEALLILTEQNIGFSSRLRITAKTISNRKTGVGVSYPQISSDGPLSAGAQSFNRRVLALTQQAIKEFDPIDGRGSFDTNYNVLLGADDVVSVEMAEFSDGGGAHPNNRFWSLTYDLRENKELKLDDIFKPDSDYKTAIANYVVADIDRRAAAMEQEDARSEGRPPRPRDESIISAEQLSEMSGWGITPRGLVVYFDFPHVIAVFDRTLVPYSVINEYLKPNTPVQNHKQ